MKIHLLVLAIVFTMQGQTHESRFGLGGARSNVPVSVTTQFRAVPSILVGGEWETSIVLVNSSTTPTAFQESFVDGSGKPVTLSIQSDSPTTGVTASAIQGALAAGSSLTLDLAPSNGGSLQEAWSLLSYEGGAIEGYAILRREAAGNAFSFEATLPLSHTQDVSTYMPFDNRQDFRSQLTLVNPVSDNSVQVRLTYLNPQGEVVLIDSLVLNPLQQITLVLPDTYPDLANKNGTVLIQADTDRLSVAGLRQNVDYGVISALPATSGPTQ